MSVPMMLAARYGLAAAPSNAAEAADASATQVTLNGLEIRLDKPHTGAIRGLRYDGPGTLLEADASEAGLVDAPTRWTRSSRCA